MPRHARLDSPGTLHHVMVRGIEQRQIVDDEADRADFVRRLGAFGCRNRDTGEGRAGRCFLEGQTITEWEFGLALRGAGPTGVIKIEIRRLLIGGLEVVCGKDPSGR